MLVVLVDVLKVLLCWISDQSCVMSELSLTIWATAEVVKLGWFTELGSVKLAAAWHVPLVITMLMSKACRWCRPCSSLTMSLA